VSLAMSIIGRLPWKLLPVYFLAQYIGAFTGAALVYAVYYGKSATIRMLVPVIPCISSFYCSMWQVWQAGRYLASLLMIR